MPEHSNHPVSFDNTASAFAYKSDRELRKARWLFSTMGKPWLLRLGLTLMPLAIRLRIPLTKTIIRNTMFQQFVGGESLEETAPVVDRLQEYQTEVILDYGVEGGEGEEAFEASTREFIRVVAYAATQPNIPFISIKVTGIARFSLLEQIDASMRSSEMPTLMKRYTAAIQSLHEAERTEWDRVVHRLQRICTEANQHRVGILVDAEESWIQDPVDALTMLMMDLFNRSTAIIYNTIQLYRHDRLSFLKDSLAAARDRSFVLGVKLVRGAYMEKERARALALQYPSPIQPNKEACDRDYDEAVLYCLQHIDSVCTILASHNESSNLLAANYLIEKGLPLKHPHLHFSQLYGMSDNITFNLAAHGYRVSKYLPFGPIRDVIPYLMRRAQENSSVAGQTGRELSLIEKELIRRRSV